MTEQGSSEGTGGLRDTSGRASGRRSREEKWIIFKITAFPTREEPGRLHPVPGRAAEGPGSPRGPSPGPCRAVPVPRPWRRGGARRGAVSRWLRREAGGRHPGPIPAAIATTLPAGTGAAGGGRTKGAPPGARTQRPRGVSAGRGRCGRASTPPPPQPPSSFPCPAPSGRASPPRRSPQQGREGRPGRAGPSPPRAGG